jgi:hypothetical protein
MEQENQKRENKDFLSALHSFSLLRVMDKDEKTILNILAWPVVVLLIASVLMGAIRYFYRKLD